MATVAAEKSWRGVRGWSGQGESGAIQLLLWEGGVWERMQILIPQVEGSSWKKKSQRED